MDTKFQVIFGVIAIYVTLGFVLSMFLKRNDIADVMWGPGVWLASVMYLWSSQATFGTNPIGYLSCALIGVWAARLFWHIGDRFLRTDTEDGRYAAWRKTWSLFYLRSYLQVFLLQGILMTIVAMPTLSMTLYVSPGNYNSPLVAIGLVIFCFGLIYEWTADYQLDDFKRNNKDDSGMLREGLWKYSRQPNYFGEICVWIGLFIIAISPALNADQPLAVIVAIAFASPAIIIFLLVKVSGIPMLERRRKAGEEFQDYINGTSALVPWFPHRKVAEL